MPVLPRPQPLPVVWTLLAPALGFSPAQAQQLWRAVHRARGAVASSWRQAVLLRECQGFQSPEAILAAVRAAPQWTFLFLTKFPQRLAEIAWPENAWVGTTVDKQYRVEIAEKAFRKVQASVTWLSCEPLRERLTFTSLDMFDWVVVGGQSKSTQAPEFQPPWEWVEHLWQQARAAQCLVYWKPNLLTRPQEYPRPQVTPCPES